MGMFERGIAAALLLEAATVSPAFAGGGPGTCGRGCEDDWPRSNPVAMVVYQRPDYDIDKWDAKRANTLRIESKTGLPIPEFGLFLIGAGKGIGEGMQEVSKNCTVEDAGDVFVYNPGRLARSVTVTDPDCIQGQAF
jgi:hypothetical protein